MFFRQLRAVPVLLLLFGSVCLGNPVPLINQPLVPDSAAPGGAGFTLTVNGTGFVSGAVVNWNGGARATTFMSGYQLTATILLSDIATPGTASVTVTSPAPGGGTSNVTYFEVTEPTPLVSFVTTTLPFDMSAEVAADFNGDGIPDLAAVNVNAGDTVSIQLGNGDGTFQPPVSYPTGDRTYPNFLAAGDFNGDGKLDLAVLLSNTDSVLILLGNGDGTFQTGVTVPLPGGPISATVGDFNGDGNLDLAVGAFYGISILLGNGDGTFQPPVNSVSEGAFSIAVGDFNVDGKLDLALASFCREIHKRLD